MVPLISSRAACKRGLESKPRLELYDPPCLAAFRASKKEVIVDKRARAEEPERNQVQIVEYIEGIGAQFDVGAFTKQSGLWESKPLGKTHINREVMRSAERVATDARRAGIDDVEVGSATTGEIATRSDERIVAGVV